MNRAPRSLLTMQIEFVLDQLECDSLRQTRIPVHLLAQTDGGMLVVATTFGAFLKLSLMVNLTSVEELDRSRDYNDDSLNKVRFNALQ
jgi:hypothetical protein